MRLSALIVAVFAASVAGCLFVDPAAPVSGVPRAIQPNLDAGKTVTVVRDIAWYGPYPPNRGVRLRAGLYTLEAEDSEYWYLRSPVPIEISTLEQMKIVSMSRLPGGLMLSKRFNAVQGAAYIDRDAEGKVMVFELGSDFHTMEGRYWIKNF